MHGLAVVRKGVGLKIIGQRKTQARQRSPRFLVSAIGREVLYTPGDCVVKVRLCLQGRISRSRQGTKNEPEATIFQFFKEACDVQD
jgi:hypothetical protein